VLSALCPLLEGASSLAVPGEYLGCRSGHLSHDSSINTSMRPSLLLLLPHLHLHPLLCLFWFGSAW
jgi:hypothetical protein